MIEQVRLELVKSLEIWSVIIRRAWGWVILSTFVEIILAITNSIVPQAETGLYISVKILTFGLSFLLMTIGVIIINQAAYDFETGQSHSILESLRKTFKQAMIESLRAMAPIMLRFLLLVIPGIMESIRLYWILYVVQFDEAYEKGEIDALERSRELVHGRFWLTSGVLLFVLVLSILPEFMGRGGSPLASPVRLGLLTFLGVSLEIFGDVILYRFYMRIKNGIKIQKQ